MKKINFENLNERNGYSLYDFLGGIQMEFIKIGKNYMIKDSNGRIVSEKEKIKLENRELIIEDIKSNNCQEKATKKIAKNKKKIKELEKTEEQKETVEIENKEETVDEFIEEAEAII